MQSVEKVTYLNQDDLSNLVTLTDDEREAIHEMKMIFPLKISDYYAELIRDSLPDDPLRKIIIPSTKELIEYDDDDKVDVHKDEANYQPVEGIIHRYPGKLLLLPTFECFGHCRFCFRAGKHVKIVLNDDKLEKALSYIKENKSIRDVVLSGGDPLTIPLPRLEYILKTLKELDHVQIVRITTRALAYAPEIFNDELIKLLSSYKPIVMIFSFMHAKEITKKAIEKFEKLSDAGLILLQQGPLLKDINDDSNTLKELYEKLIMNRVITYYANYGAPTKGTRHFVVSRDEAKAILADLENKTSGFCVPHIITLDQNNNKTRSMN